MAGTLTVTGYSASEPGGQRILGPISNQGQVVVGESIVSPLNSGDNTFTIPSASLAYTGFVLVPPTNGSAQLTVRFSTNSGDAGMPVSSALWSAFAFQAGSVPTSVIVNSSAGQAAPITLWFY